MDFSDAADRLRRMAQQIPQESAEELREIGTELVADARLSVRTTLPRRGGYADDVARGTRFDVRVTRTSTGARLTITATGPDYRLDRDGRLRHPVYARGPRNEWNWANEAQKVRPGWFTRPMREGRPRIRAGLVAAVSRTTKRRG